MFGWHVLEVDKGRHNIPMPAPGPWTLQVRFMQVARGSAGPVGTYSLAVTGEWWGEGEIVAVALLCCCFITVLMLWVAGFLLPDDKIVNEADVKVNTSVSWNGSYGSAHPAVYNGRSCVLKVRFRAWVMPGVPKVMQLSPLWHIRAALVWPSPSPPADAYTGCLISIIFLV
jgi:hypothetical protein